MGTKISAYTEVTAPAESDVTVVVDSGATKKVQLKNLVRAVAAIGARVFHNTTQSIADNTVTILNFNSERFDTNVIHDNSTNNSRLTCKTAGVYQISAQIGFASNATGYRNVNILLNGSTVIGSKVISAVNGVVTRLSLATIYVLAVNDYVEVQVLQTSGGALNTEQAGNYSPEFMMVRQGA